MEPERLAKRLEQMGTVILASTALLFGYQAFEHNNAAIAADAQAGVYEERGFYKQGEQLGNIANY